MERYTVYSECVLGFEVIAKADTLGQAQAIIAKEKKTNDLVYWYSIVDNTTNKEVIF